MFKNDIIKAAAEQLSIDMNCSSKDFFSEKNILVFSKKMFGRRMIPPDKSFFHIATFGKGCVASVSSEIYNFTAALLEKVEGIKIFDAQGVYVVNKELDKYGKALGPFHQFFLPATPFSYIDRGDFKMEIFEGIEIQKLYSDKRFTNALLYTQNELRRDMIAVCAKNGDEIIGVAGASNDSERMWQIGVDVIPEFRQKGVAAAIVSSITQEILMRGAIPYYGTWWSNIASQNVARSCGYYPAWSETYAVDI